MQINWIVLIDIWSLTGQGLDYFKINRWMGGDIAKTSLTKTRDGLKLPETI